jgi:hypothetical protein
VLQAVGAVAAAAGLAARSAGGGRAAPHRAAQEDGDAPGPRDFAATAASLARSPHLAGFASDGGATYLTAEAAGRAQVFAEGVNERLFGDYGLRQVHVYRYLSEGELDSLFLFQSEFPDPESAAAAYDAMREALAQPGAQDITVEIPGQSQSVTVRYNFETGDRYIDRVDTLFQAEEIVVTGTYDTISTEPTNRSEWSEDWHRNVFGGLIEAYDDRAWGGEVGQEAQKVTSWIPLVEGPESFRHYLGIVDGDVVGRYRVPAEQLAAENPGVETALFGSYGLTGGLGPMSVYFDVRSFPDQGASDEYFGQLPSLFQEYRSGVNWRFAESYVESEIPHLAHGGTWNPAEDVYLVGAHVAIQAETIAFGVGAFVPFTGDAAAFAEVDPTAEREYVPLSEGAIALMGDVREAALEFDGWGYLPGAGYDVPESWR